MLQNNLIAKPGTVVVTQRLPNQNTNLNLATSKTITSTISINTTVTTACPTVTVAAANNNRNLHSTNSNNGTCTNTITSFTTPNKTGSSISGLSIRIPSSSSTHSSEHGKNLYFLNAILTLTLIRRKGLFLNSVIY